VCVCVCVRAKGIPVFPDCLLLLCSLTRCLAQAPLKALYKSVYYYYYLLLLLLRMSDHVSQRSSAGVAKMLNRQTDRHRHTHTHTHTHPFNGPLSGTTRMSRYQKGKTNLDFTEARDSKWQWHQLGHVQVSTSLKT